MTKKILIFCSPFGGHTTILKEFVKQYCQSFEIKFVITGWKNITSSLEDIDVPIIKLGDSNLLETDPAVWTFPRVNELIGECLIIAENFKPDLVFYDFFSLEGYFVGQKLNIPYWSSIPAMIGPFDKQEYVQTKMSETENAKALQNLSVKIGKRIDPDTIEMISDGLHIPGTRNIVWSYRSVVPENWRSNRSDATYDFVGNIRAKKILLKHKQTTVLFSLGTVVMNNIWNQQQPIRGPLTEFIRSIAEIWRDKPWSIIFSTQGREILNTYPPNWRVENFVDQIQTLAISDIFITHGGGNSFNESLVQQIPMIVIPFFGDQRLVGEQVEKLGIGYNLLPNQTIDTHKSHDYLSSELVLKLDKAVETIIRNKLIIQENFDKINMQTDSLSGILEAL